MLNLVQLMCIILYEECKMQIVTLKIEDSVFDKFQWLISHFLENEIGIVNEIDSSRLLKDDFDYISDKKLSRLKQDMLDYKNGNRDDFEEYSL